MLAQSGYPGIMVNTKGIPQLAERHIVPGPKEVGAHVASPLPLGGVMPNAGTGATIGPLGPGCPGPLSGGPRRGVTVPSQFYPSVCLARRSQASAQASRGKHVRIVVRVRRGSQTAGVRLGAIPEALMRKVP